MLRVGAFVCMTVTFFYAVHYDFIETNVDAFYCVLVPEYASYGDSKKVIEPLDGQC